jgi:Methyl-accepting chemotaxis protein (MCP) signalling domain
MKLQMKLVLVLVASIAAICIVSQVVQQRIGRALMERLATAQIRHEETVQWNATERLLTTSRQAITDAMAAGEMDRVQKLVDGQREVSGVLELSIYNRLGNVVISSDRSRLKQPLPPELGPGLLASEAPQKRLTDAAFEVYVPMPATKTCIECHNEFKGVKIGGVLAYRVSTAELRSAQGDWANFVTSLSRSLMGQSIIAGLLLCAVVAGLIVLCIQRLVARPLHRVNVMLRDASTQVSSAVAQMSGTSNSLAQGASQQAASIEETSASLEEIQSMSQRSTENARQAKQLAEETRTAAQQGTKQMAEMIAAMDAIKASSDGVAKVVRTIDEIAFQTNILALNAAVEAARVGEVGRGFSIVADEVRALALRSAEAAKETANMVNDSIQKSAAGAAISKRVAGSLLKIDEQAQAVDALIAQIAVAATEQGQGIGQINHAVTDLDRVTQANAANAEDGAAAARQLSAQADTLLDNVSTLSQMVGSTEEIRPAAAAPAESVFKASPPPKPPKPAPSAVQRN